jgi:hypothetical protein
MPRSINYILKLVWLIESNRKPQRRRKHWSTAYNWSKSCQHMISREAAEQSLGWIDTAARQTEGELFVCRCRRWDVNILTGASHEEENFNLHNQTVVHEVRCGLSETHWIHELRFVLGSNTLIRRFSPTFCWVRLLIWFKQSTKYKICRMARTGGPGRWKRIGAPENYKKHFKSKKG